MQRLQNCISRDYCDIHLISEYSYYTHDGDYGHWALEGEQCTLYQQMNYVQYYLGMDKSIKSIADLPNHRPSTFTFQRP